MRLFLLLILPAALLACEPPTPSCCRLGPVPADKPTSGDFEDGCTDVAVPADKSTEAGTTTTTAGACPLDPVPTDKDTTG